MNTSKQSHFLKEILQSDEISVKTKKNDNLKTKKNQKKSPNTNSNSSCSTSNSHSPEDEEEKLFLLKNENNKGIGIQQRNEVLMKIIGLLFSFCFKNNILHPHKFHYSQLLENQEVSFFHSNFLFSSKFL